MKLVSSWSHYLDFECNDCGENTHVDAARDFSTAVTCRSIKCRTSSAWSSCKQQPLTQDRNTGGSPWVPAKVSAVPLVATILSEPTDTT